METSQLIERLTVAAGDDTHLAETVSDLSGEEMDAIPELVARAISAYARAQLALVLTLTQWDRENARQRPTAGFAVDLDGDVRIL